MIRRALLPTVAVVATLVLVASSCAGEDPIVLEAVFEDVIDLVPGGFVKAGDITVGRIESIELTDDDRARVTLSVRPDSGVPARVEAVLKQTSLLGERFVELRPLEPGGDLASGTIERTRVVSDLEDLVSTSNDLLAGVAADRLATAVQTGALAFGGRGGTLGTLLERLELFVGDYERGKGEIVRLLDAADVVLTGLASEADTNAQAIAELARASQALEEEDDRLLDALSDLRRLAQVSEEILAAHRVEMDGFVHRVRLILEQVLRIDGALQNVLTWLPRHNLHVPNGVLFEHAQVWNDFSLCGYDSERDNASNSCDPPNPGEPNAPPPSYTGPDTCDLEHEGCPYPEGAEPYHPGEDPPGATDRGGGP